MVTEVIQRMIVQGKRRGETAKMYNGILNAAEILRKGVGVLEIQEMIERVEIKTDSLFSKAKKESEMALKQRK